MFCIKCGEKMKEDAQFCIKCGTKVEKSSEKENLEKNIKKEEPKKESILHEPKNISVNNISNNQNNNGSKTALIIVLSIVGGLIVVGLIVLLLWIFVFKKGLDTYQDLSNNINNELKENNNKKEENYEIEKDNEKEVEKREKSGIKISLYKTYENEYIFFFYSKETGKNYYETDEYTKVGEYECYSYNCKYKDGFDNSIIVYDEDYILYDINTKKETKLDLNADSTNDVRFIYYDKKVYGLQVAKYDKYAYFDLSKKKYITDFEYSGFNYDGALKINKIVGYKITDSDEIGMYMNADYYLINIKNGKIEYEAGNTSSFQTKELNNHIYYTKYVVTDNEQGGYEIYNDKFEKIAENVIMFGLINNGNIMIKNKNTFSIYNSKGNLVKESKEYTEIMLIVDNYIAVIDDGYLKLIDSNEKEVANFTSWNENMRFHSMISGYYTDTTSKVYGVYLVVEDESIPEGTKGRGKEYYYGTENGKTGVIELEYIGGYAKPVLYLYPETKTNIEVTFENPNMLTTTYPKYINKWNVTALPNGDLYDASGRYYYGLYWEELKNHDIEFSEGFYVTKDDAIKFLEEKLDKLGFNNREANEFIMYWLPILESNGQSLVYFELTEERELYNKINIYPKPDSMLRVAMHVKKVNEKVDIKEQVLPSFNRVGFSAIEWGGVIH